DDDLTSGHERSILVNDTRPWEAAAGQRQAETRAALGRDQFECAAVSGGDAKRNREPESWPGTGGSSLEKRLEDPSGHVWRNTRAVVADLDDHPVLLHRRAHGQDAPDARAGHRLLGVQDEIDHNLLDL